MPIHNVGNDAHYILSDNQELVKGCKRLFSGFIKFLKKIGGEIKGIRFEKVNGKVSPFSLKFELDSGGKKFTGDICIQRALIRNAVVRVDKRICYFGIFHRIRPNEIKEAALYAYWILKFRPFMVSGSLQLEKDLETLNERFALFLILAACGAVAVRRALSTKSISKELRNEVIYAFQYQDLTKEAVIKIAEMIGEAFFGIPLIPSGNSTR